MDSLLHNDSHAQDTLPNGRTVCHDRECAASGFAYDRSYIAYKQMANSAQKLAAVKVRTRPAEGWLDDVVWKNLSADTRTFLENRGALHLYCRGSRESHSTILPVREVCLQCTVIRQKVQAL
jgi:hypothetical protein